MFEKLGLEGWTPLSASLVLGAALGVAFGILAQRSRFCLRRGLVGSEAERSDALATWLIALAAAIAGTTAIAGLGYVDFSEHRFLTTQVPILAILSGGAMFGAGMVLTRGCASRLTVLAGSGNLRALTVVVVFAVLAHATLKGVFAPARVWLGSFTVDMGQMASLASLPGGSIVWGGLLATALIVIAVTSGARWSHLAMGFTIGALVPLGWLGTGYVLADEFNPIALDSMAFTSSASSSLFYSIAGTAIEPGFGVGLFSGALAGAGLAALASREFKIVGFTAGTPTGNYLLGASLMGVGGVLAGGCTVGAGLSGISTLSIAAIIALLAIAISAKATDWALRASWQSKATVPAE